MLSNQSAVSYHQELLTESCRRMDYFNAKFMLESGIATSIEGIWWLNTEIRLTYAVSYGYEY